MWNSPAFPLLLETLMVVLSVLSNHFLAQKKKSGWLLYVMASVLMVIIMIQKDSWITIFNQSSMGVVGMKNWYDWYRREHHLQRLSKYIHTSIRALCVFVFIYTMVFLDVRSFASWVELSLWFCIIGKTLFLGEERLSGWIFLLAQGGIGVVFGIQKGIFVYTALKVIQSLQSLYGLWKWKH